MKKIIALIALTSALTMSTHGVIDKLALTQLFLTNAHTLHKLNTCQATMIGNLHLLKDKNRFIKKHSLPLNYKQFSFDNASLLPFLSKEYNDTKNLIHEFKGYLDGREILLHRLWNLKKILVQAQFKRTVQEGFGCVYETVDGIHTQLKLFEAEHTLGIGKISDVYTSVPDFKLACEQVLGEYKFIDREGYFECPREAEKLELAFKNIKQRLPADLQDICERE